MSYFSEQARYGVRGLSDRPGLPVLVAGLQPSHHPRPGGGLPAAPRPGRPQAARADRGSGGHQ